MTRALRAFAISLSPENVIAPTVFGVERFNKDVFFKIQNIDGKTDKARSSYISVNSAYYAKVLAALMKVVHKFQLSRIVGPRCYQKEGQEYLENLGATLPDIYNYDDSWCRKNIPFGIQMVDKKHKFNPCFFVQEYKMRDENGHPLYLAVMLERKTENPSDENLYDFNIKFMGACQPLTKLIKRIPLCNSDKEYQQKSDEYRVSHQDYYEEWKNEICRALAEKGFREHFTTYDTKTNKRWDTCEHEILTKQHCGKRMFDDYEIGQKVCWEYRCPFYRGYKYDIVNHDGREVLGLFREAFGPNVTDLVSNGKWTIGDISMLPDVSNPDFIRAFNRFVEQEYGVHRVSDKIRFGRLMQSFDTYGDIAKSKDMVKNTACIVQKWAFNPNVVTINGKEYPLPKVGKKTSEGPNENPEVSKPVLSPKKALFNRYMERVQYPAILIESPGRIQVTDVFDIPYWDEDGDNFWDTNIDVWVEYNKPKSKQKHVGYRFTRVDLGYDFCEAMREMSRWQSKADLKWAPSRLLVHEDKSFDGKLDRKDKKFNWTDDDKMVCVQRVNKDYDGVTILDSNRMKPIVCAHYELRRTNDAYGNILLFNKNGQVTGFIACRNPDVVIPHIVVRRTRTKER